LWRADARRPATSSQLPRSALRQARSGSGPAVTSRRRSEPTPRTGPLPRTFAVMTPDELADLAHLRRARDRIDRDFAEPLDVPSMARTACMSPAHFSRKFRVAYGETPY